MWRARAKNEEEFKRMERVLFAFVSDNTASDGVRFGEILYNGLIYEYGAHKIGEHLYIENTGVRRVEE